jgi:hypothetical protein
MQSEFTQVCRLLEKFDLPSGDLYDLPTSKLAFPDGAHFRNEISFVDTLADMESLVREMGKRQIAIHRVIALGPGATCATRSELRDWVQMGHEHKIEILVHPGPKPEWDVGSHVHSSWGRASGRRTRGADGVAYYLADVMRCIDAGLRGFILFDEGILYLLNQMRKCGDIPGDVVFKMSYTAGHGSPPGFRLLEELGADSVNPVTDLEPPALAALRQTIRIPMDLVIVAHEGLGGINRMWQTPEIIRVASPCYLKQEVSGDPAPRVKNCEILLELVARVRPELRLSAQGPEDLRLPVI